MGTAPRRRTPRPELSRDREDAVDQQAERTGERVGRCSREADRVEHDARSVVGIDADADLPTTFGRRSKRSVRSKNAGAGRVPAIDEERCGDFRDELSRGNGTSRRARFVMRNGVGKSVRWMSRIVTSDPEPARRSPPRALAD